MADLIIWWVGLTIFNLFTHVIAGFVLFQIPIFPNRCSECNSTDVQFDSTSVETRYRHVTKSGQPDRRFKNNRASSIRHLYHCNACGVTYPSCSRFKRFGLISKCLAFARL